MVDWQKALNLQPEPLLEIFTIADFQHATGFEPVQNQSADLV